MKQFVEKNFSPNQLPKIIKTFDNEMEKMENAEKTQLSPKDFKVASNSIFDRIAAYKAFQCYVDPDQARGYCKDYFYARVEGVRKLLHWLTKTNTGANIFKNIFVMGLKKGVLKYELKTHNKEGLAFDIHQCLYHDLCEKYGCPELTGLFCKGDHFLFDDMKKIDFQRSQTLGEGGELCDFHFNNR